MSGQIQTKRLFAGEPEQKLDKKRVKSDQDKTPGEVDLEKLVFGGEDLADSAVFNDDVEEKEESSEDEQEDSLFYVDTERDGPDTAAIEESEESEESEVASEEEAAWEDDDMQNSRVALKATARTRKLRVEEDEDEVSGDVYEQRLRQQFEKINPAPKWASMDNDEADGILQSSLSLLSKKQALLPPNIIDIVRQRNANQEAPSQAVVQSVQFHPTASVLLTAGMDKTLRLFEVDGKENHKVQSIYFKDLPITTAQFIRQGQEVVVSGRRSWYYSVDVEKGKVTRINSNPKLKSLESMRGSAESDRLAFMSNSGQIHLVSARTKQFVHTLQMNGPVRDVSFTADGNYLWSIGLDNEVYQWDLRQNQCLTRWHDPTVFRPTCLQVSRDSSYYASGDDAGVINIYDTRLIESQPFVNVKPFKSISNLTTAIQGIKFNHSSELVAVYSRKKKDQLKLVHLPTATVFTNWPGSVSHLGHVQCVDFSPNSGFMAIGNDTGKALLYRLQHYSVY